MAKLRSGKEYTVQAAGPPGSGRRTQLPGRDSLGRFIRADGGPSRVRKRRGGRRRGGRRAMSADLDRAVRGSNPSPSPEVGLPVVNLATPSPPPPASAGRSALSSPATGSQSSSATHSSGSEREPIPQDDVEADLEHYTELLLNKYAKEHGWPSPDTEEKLVNMFRQQRLRWRAAMEILTPEEEEKRDRREARVRRHKDAMYNTQEYWEGRGNPKALTADDQNLANQANNIEVRDWAYSANHPMHERPFSCSPTPSTTPPPPSPPFPPRRPSPPHIRFTLTAPGALLPADLDMDIETSPNPQVGQPGVIGGARSAVAAPRRSIREQVQDVTGVPCPQQ